MEKKMFCFQCAEAAGCTGCTIKGVCGKTPQLAGLQDLLVYTTKGLSEVAIKAREEGIVVKTEVNNLVTMNLFKTITNANFDNEVFYISIRNTLAMKNELLEKITDKSKLREPALWSGKTNEEFEAKSKTVGVLSTENEDIRSLRELVIYGLKGLSAYLKHANVLGFDNEEISIFMETALAKTTDNTVTVEQYVALTLETGKFGVDGMALLDTANTTTYGNPEASKVNIGVKENPGILVSGHDLKDLEQLLEQTKGTGIDVYTHSEML
ncbi:MAG: hydroxylamine reductase, partial [Clostridium sp.]